jgi:hypothetical protein
LFWLALNHHPPNLSLLSSQDEELVPGYHTLVDVNNVLDNVVGSRVQCTRRAQETNWSYFTRVAGGNTAERLPSL